MNIVKKDERSTNPKIEKLNSSDTECLKTSNDKLVDVLTKTKIEKNEILSKKSSIKIVTELKSFDDEEESLDEDDDNIKIEKKSKDKKKTTAAEVLNHPKMEPKENLKLLKFNLCFLVKKNLNG